MESKIFGSQNEKPQTVLLLVTLCSETEHTKHSEIHTTGLDLRCSPHSPQIQVFKLKFLMS